MSKKNQLFEKELNSETFENELEENVTTDNVTENSKNTNTSNEIIQDDNLIKEDTTKNVESTQIIDDSSNQNLKKLKSPKKKRVKKLTKLYAY